MEYAAVVGTDDKYCNFLCSSGCLVDDIDVAYNVNDDFVADLALEIENGKKINPVVLHQELSYYDVIDGCHRVEAYKDEGKKYITTYVAIQSKRK